MHSKLWNCNSLWKIWYGLLITLMQFYVTYNCIRKYIIFKSQYYNPRYGGVWNIGPLHLYIGCIIASTSLLGFFIYFCVIGVRSHTNGNNRSYLNMENENTNKCFGPISKLVSKLIREKIPYAPLLHVIMAACLLLPIPVVQMEQIRNEALSSDSIWIVNFDFFSDHFRWLMMESLSDDNPFRNIHYIHKTSTLSIEFINFIVAVVILLIRFPSTLWYANKWFSIIFSSVIFFNSITWIIIYEAGSVFIKSSGNQGSFNIPLKISDQIHYGTMFSFVGIHFFLMLLGFLAIFDYGQTQSAVNWLKGFKTINLFGKNNLNTNCWICSVIAVGFSLLLITLIIDSIILVSFFHTFQMFGFRLFLVAIVLGIVNLIFQFLIWFTFSIKNRWVFNLELKEVIQGANCITENGTKYTGSPDTIYGCFHNNITLSTSSSHSSGRGTNRTMEGSSADSGCYGTNYQNYVFLQNPANQIPTISEDYDENTTNTSKSSSINLKEIRNSSLTDQDLLYRTASSISDNGLNKINDNMVTDSFRSLQMMNNRKSGKLVTFHEVGEEKLPFFGTYDKQYSNTNMDQLNFLKVPDILNLNRSTLSGSQSESSLDQISSSLSSKVAMEPNENGMCSEV